MRAIFSVTKMSDSIQINLDWRQFVCFEELLFSLWEDNAASHQELAVKSGAL